MRFREENSCNYSQRAGIIFITFAIVELENFLQLGKHLMCDSQTIHTRRERERGGTSK